jgi:predicted transposase YbfD/YdcC
MGCQYKIADQIVVAGADYVLSLKKNLETLYDDVKTYFEGLDFAHPVPLIKTGSTFEVDHGRQEQRNHAVTDDVSWLVAAHPVWSDQYLEQSLFQSRFVNQTGGSAPIP